MGGQKRYQVFVSSTHKDLRHERESIINELTKIGYIAVGMEQFPATDEEQMEFIRPIIDESDYYVVIIKARYGEVTSNKLSYTEEEYKYAVDRKIPVMAFLYKDISKLPMDETDQDGEKLEQLKRFSQELESKRIVKYWDNKEELVSGVKDSLNDMTRRRPGIGWIRGDQAADISLFKELDDLRKENALLKSQKTNNGVANIFAFTAGVAHGKAALQMSFSSFDEVEEGVEKDRRIIHKNKQKHAHSTTWDSLFSVVYAAIFENTDIASGRLGAKQEEIDNFICAYIKQEEGIEKHIYLDNPSIDDIRLQLVALDLITTFPYRVYLENTYLWHVTDKGEKYYAYIHAAKTSQE